MNLKEYLKENKIIICTHCHSMTTGAMSLFTHSLKTYINYLDDNFVFFPTKEGEQYLNVSVFADTFLYLYKNREFKYMIFIDEDCFLNIKDKNFESSFMMMFEEFKKSGCVFAGMPDGGSICHRNHNPYLINPFFSFWNLDLIFENTVEKDFEQYKNYQIVQRENNSLYPLFLTLPEYLRKHIKSNWIINNTNTINARGNRNVPKAESVKCDLSNPIEPYQKPYSYNETEVGFEPYYPLQLMIIKKTQRPVFYFICVDSLIDDGTTSEVIALDKTVLAYHTWFSRGYTKFNQTQYNRIRKIIDHLK